MYTCMKNIKNHYYSGDIARQKGLFKVDRLKLVYTQVFNIIIATSTFDEFNFDGVETNC